MTGLTVEERPADDMLAAVLFLLVGAAADPTNLLINGGCEASGGSACTTNVTCPADSWWLLSENSACGVWCTGGTVQTTGNINGWTQQGSGVGQCGFACVYQNIVESPMYGGRIIGAPYEGSSFLSEITANCSVNDPVPILSHVINFPTNAYAAINAGLVTVYAFAAGAVGNDTGLVIQVKFRNSAFNQIGTSIFLSISSGVGNIPSSIVWQTGTTTSIPPPLTTMMQVQIQSHTFADEFSPFAQIDGVTIYAYSAACFAYPTFPTGQTNSSNCNASYTMPGGTCTLQCLPTYMSSGGNFTAVCNSTWTSASQVYNNWIVGSGACVPTNSESASHESESRSYSHRSASHASHSHESSSHHSGSHESDSHSSSHRSKSHHSPNHTHSNSHHSGSHESDSHSKSHHSKSHHSLNQTHSNSHHSGSHESDSHSKSYRSRSRRPHTTSESESKSHHSRSRSPHTRSKSDSKSHRSRSRRPHTTSESDSAITKSHISRSSGNTHSHSHRSKSHHSSNRTHSASHRSHSHNSHSPSHRSPSHHSPSHRSTSHNSKSHRSKSHRSKSHNSKSHHSTSHESPEHTESESPSVSFPGNMFPAPDLIALIVILPIIAFFALCCIIFLLCRRRYLRRRRGPGGGYMPLAQSN